MAALGRVRMLDRAPRAALERLASAASLEEAAAESVVVREGADADAFYVVVDGRLAVTSTGDRAGAAVALGELGPGDCFGEIGLIHRRPRTATVTARTDCTLYRVPGADFLTALSASPAAAPAVSELAGMRLARSHAGDVRPARREASASPAVSEEEP
jgi:CRP-like cAMP-binding protein